jgi:hypothetical protein
MSDQDFKSFEEFWPYYMGEHSQPATRTLHAVGTAVSTGLVLAAIADRNWKLLPLALLPGYGAAWIGHFLIEKNKPATLEHPVWSLIADYKMLAMMIRGEMDEELVRLKKAETEMHELAAND